MSHASRLWARRQSVALTFSALTLLLFAVPAHAELDTGSESFPNPAANHVASVTASLDTITGTWTATVSMQPPVDTSGSSYLNIVFTTAFPASPNGACPSNDQLQTTLSTALGGTLAAFTGPGAAITNQGLATTSVYGLSVTKSVSADGSTVMLQGVEAPARGVQYACVEPYFVIANAPVLSLVGTPSPSSQFTIRDTPPSIKLSPSTGAAKDSPYRAFRLADARGRARLARTGPGNPVDEVGSVLAQARLAGRAVLLF